MATLPSIRENEWLQAVQEAGIEEVKDDPTCLTFRELRVKFGKGRDLTTKWLRGLIEQGAVIKTVKRFRDARGRIQTAVAYRLVKPEAKQAPPAFKPAPPPKRKKRRSKK